MILAGAKPRRDEAPLAVAKHLLAKLGEARVVSLELLARVDVIVVVIHGAVGVEPTLHALREILRLVLACITLLLAAEHDEDLVFAGDLHRGVGWLFIHQDVAAVETALEQIGGFLGKCLHQRIKKTDGLIPFHPAEPLGGETVVPDALGFHLLERFLQLTPLVCVEARSVDDVTELVDEDAFNLHAALVFHDILLGEQHRGTLVNLGQETTLPPVVEIKLAAGFVTLKLRHVRGQLVLGHQHAEHLALTDSHGHLRLDGLHHPVELIGSLQDGVVGHPLRGGDEDILHHRAFPIERRIKLVFGSLSTAQGLDLVGAGQSRERGEKCRLQQRLD